MAWKKSKTPAQSKAPKLTDPRRARIFAIVARDARRAVVFRRGPTRKTLLLNWNLRDDTLEPGQWFFGRIYERRCDLSPSGELLVYFAAKHTGPYGSWTAVSRPPYFTALALWPKGDTWGGGGLFQNSRALLLNHDSSKRTCVPLQGIPDRSDLAVKPFGAYPGGGEDNPIYFERLERDGWTLWPGVEEKEQAFTAPVWIVYDPPIVRTLRLTDTKERPLLLRVLVHGYHEQNGRSWVETADVVDGEGSMLRDFGRIDWVDVDHNGDILIARDGRLERLRRGAIKSGAPPQVVADLHDMTFAPVEAPEWAKTWTRRPPGAKR